MNAADYPILEYDPSPVALIEPSRLLSPIDIPPHCVLCFFQDVIAGLDARGLLRQVYSLGSEMGPNPVYALEVDHWQSQVSIRERLFWLAAEACLLL